MLSRKRDTNTAKRFFKKALKNSKDYLPYKINTDQYYATTKAISDLKEEWLIDKAMKHSKIKYLNNILESDYFIVKKPMKLIHSFQNFFSTSRAIKGMEFMLMIKKKQCLMLYHFNLKISSLKLIIYLHLFNPKSSKKLMTYMHRTVVF